MFTLNFEEYCETCARLEIRMDTIYADNVPYSRIITCAHIADCKNIEQHIRNTIEKETSK